MWHVKEKSFKIKHEVLTRTQSKALDFPIYVLSWSTGIIPEKLCRVRKKKKNPILQFHCKKWLMHVFRSEYTLFFLFLAKNVGRQHAMRSRDTTNKFGTSLLISNKRGNSKQFLIITSSGSLRSRFNILGHFRFYNIDDSFKWYTCREFKLADPRNFFGRRVIYLVFQ